MNYAQPGEPKLDCGFCQGGEVCWACRIDFERNGVPPHKRSPGKRDDDPMALSQKFLRQSLGNAGIVSEYEPRPDLSFDCSADLGILPDYTMKPICSCIGPHNVDWNRGISR